MSKTGWALMLLYKALGSIEVHDGVFYGDLRGGIWECRIQYKSVKIKIGVGSWTIRFGVIR